MRLETLYEDLTTGAIAAWPRTSFFKRRKASKGQRILTQTERQFQSDGPLPPYEDKPKLKTVLNRRAKVDTSTQ
jgi:hypothetical protein